MRMAIISDIHSNLEAFKEVLADIERSDIDVVVCLGDNIGYGPDPEAVVNLVRENRIPCVMGNHELAVVDESFLNWFNPSARKSLAMNLELLSQDSIDYIHTLRTTMVVRGCLLVHGCPPDSPTRYLFELTDAELLELFATVDERISFVGHTHDLELVDFNGQEVAYTPMRKSPMELRDDHRYIINVGSIGQPRDGNNNAKYVIWDEATRLLEIRYVPYDIGATVARIRELGLPDHNARRLW